MVQMQIRGRSCQNARMAPNAPNLATCPQIRALNGQKGQSGTMATNTAHNGSNDNYGEYYSNVCRLRQELRMALMYYFLSLKQQKLL